MVIDFIGDTLTNTTYDSAYCQIPSTDFTSTVSVYEYGEEGNGRLTIGYNSDHGIVFGG